MSKTAAAELVDVQSQVHRVAYLRKSAVYFLDLIADTYGCPSRVTPMQTTGWKRWHIGMYACCKPAVVFISFKIYFPEGKGNNTPPSTTTLTRISAADTPAQRLACT